MKVAIDPGHGMSNRRKGVYDPGATHVEDGTPYEEAAITLRFGLTLKDVFRARGHDVFMTRDDAQDHAPVRERSVNAQNAGATLFISLHLNDYDDDSANGLEVLYGRNESKALAQKLQDALVKATGFKDRKIKKREDLSVLRFNGPAVLIELGFIAHDGNRTTLLNPQKRQQICESIADAAVAGLA